MEHLGFQLYCYNKNYKTFFARVFENVRDFTPQRQYFEALRQRMVKVYANHKLSEPCQLANNYFNEACFTDCCSLDRMLVGYENITYEKFLKQMKEQWLKRLHVVWLIQGHLEEADAMEIVTRAETSLAHQRIHTDDIDFARLVRLNDRTIYSFERTNESPENPNSLCWSRFAYEFDTDVDTLADAKVLSAFLEEPVFNALRTKEQLGYIVQAGAMSHYRMLFFSILVQSNHKDADYLEHRINELLEKIHANWDPTEEQIETIKSGLMNKMKQKRTSLGAEASFNWTEL